MMQRYKKYFALLTFGGIFFLSFFGFCSQMNTISGFGMEDMASMSTQNMSVQAPCEAADEGCQTVPMDHANFFAKIAPTVLTTAVAFFLLALGLFVLSIFSSVRDVVQERLRVRISALSWHRERSLMPYALQYAFATGILHPQLYV